MSREDDEQKYVWYFTSKPKDLSKRGIYKFDV